MREGSAHINSKSYWDRRFNEDWEENQGREQTRFFCELAFQKLPNWLVSKIKQKQLSVCDWGCAEGDGTQLLSQKLNTEVVGVDFSESAIARARSCYPSREFVVGDVLSGDVDLEFDIVFSSNTLEHFSDPWVVAERVADMARKALIFLLPFREFERISEHEYTFDFSNVRAKLSGFDLCHVEIFDAAVLKPTYWPGDQVLLVYAEEKFVPRSNLSLSDLRVDSESTYSMVNSLSSELGESAAKVKSLEAELLSAASRIQSLEDELRGQVAKAHELEASLKLLRDTAVQSEQYLQLANARIAEIENSNSWKLTAPLRHASSMLMPPTTRKQVGYYMSRIGGGVRRHGILRSIPKGLEVAKTVFQNEYRKATDQDGYNKRLEELKALIGGQYLFIDLFPVPMGWNTPLFQRFQHFSIEATRLGGLALYGGHPQVDRDMNVFYQAANGVVVFDATDAKVVEVVFEALAASGNRVVLRLQSIDTATPYSQVESWLLQGFEVVYEYIDEITDAITGEVPQDIQVRHREVLSDERVRVVATSDKLAAEVSRYRKANFMMLTNGVDVSHWRTHASIPEEVREIKENSRILVGYHGALAEWVDFDLLRGLADREGVELLLIGYEHDQAFKASGLLDHDSVHYLGSKSYFELHRYAKAYDVAVLPFRLNELTESVSPVKVFEYMAAGVPVVTTDLPECRKYRSCLIATSIEDFADKVEVAATLAFDPGYMDCLKNEAEENSWESKARRIFGVEMGGAV